MEIKYRVEDYVVSGWAEVSEEVFWECVERTTHEVEIVGTIEE